MYLDLEDDETDKEAAIITRGILQDPGNQAWYIAVTDAETGRHTLIDVSDDV